tara:strand:+ start:1246 stop:1425 length:180 start_codon:yes stop_codon:yes gene_type:complete
LAKKPSNEPQRPQRPQRTATIDEIVADMNEELRNADRMSERIRRSTRMIPEVLLEAANR